MDSARTRNIPIFKQNKMSIYWVLAVGVDRISFFGSLDITLDKEGLVKAKYLKSIIDSALLELEAATLPDKIALRPVDIVDNPF